MRRLELMRRILLLLCFTAAPLRQAPISQAAWAWPATAATFGDRPSNDNGNTLPKTTIWEMAQEEEPEPDIDFPPNNDALPPYLKRRWRLLQQRQDKIMKKLRVRQLWVDHQSPAGKESKRIKLKRAPIQWPSGEPDEASGQPRYPYAYAWPKRQPSRPRSGLRYQPTISAGVMTNLGDFFNELKSNVLFQEQSQEVGEAKAQLLEGRHPPPPMKTSFIPGDQLSYRPSQRIRALVSRNPDGYRGSEFIDPSYMWLGLGK